MAQITALSPTALPGLPYIFVAKEESVGDIDKVFTLIVAQTYLDGAAKGETYLDGITEADTYLDGAVAAQTEPS